jgi:tRNA(Ile)-lysidine synthase
MSYSQLLEQLGDQLPTNKPVYVGYSGGLDSSLLLHAACDVLDRQRVVAIHCNHGISPEAEQWQKFCEQQAQQLKIQLVVERLHFPDGFTEVEGRNARYKVFSSHMQDGALLLLGHHADDHAETVLFRLFRGTGTRGLAGIPAERAFARGSLMRPLITNAKSDLKEIAEAQGIEWIEDESNKDKTFDRNFIRQKLIPDLQLRWPNAVQSIVRTAERLRQDVGLLDDYADELLARVDYSSEGSSDVIGSIDIEKLGMLPTSQQSLLLRRFLSVNLGMIPEALNTEEALSQFILAKPDSEPFYPLGRTELRRFHSRLYLLNTQKKLVSEQDRQWNGRAPLDLSGGTLSLVKGAPEDFTVSFRSGGERLKPEGRKHSQTLKKILQEYAVEPWVRNQIPLIYLDDQLIAVGDRIFCTEHRFEWVRK